MTVPWRSFCRIGWEQDAERNMMTHGVCGARTSSRWRSQHQEGSYRDKRCRCWNEASFCFSTTTALQMCKIGIPLTMDPTLHCRMMGDLLNRAAAGCAKTERNRQLSELVMFVETGAELSESPGTEVLSTWHDEWRGCRR